MKGPDRPDMAPIEIISHRLYSITDTVLDQKTKESTTNILQNQIIGVSKTSIKNILYFTLVGGNLVQNMGGNVTGWSHVTTGTKFFTQSTVGLLHLSMLCVFLKSNGHRKA